MTPSNEKPLNLALNDYLSDVGLDKWFARLRATNAPVPRQNVREALRFFSQQMTRLPPSMAADFLDAMDLSKPVRAITLKQGERLLGFRGGDESQFKLFFTRRGASPYSTGINPAGRRAVHFVVRVPAAALESYASPANDSWTKAAPGQQLTVDPRHNTTAVMAAGGNVQLIIPESGSRLQVERDA